MSKIIPVLDRFSINVLINIKNGTRRDLVKFYTILWLYERWLSQFWRALNVEAETPILWPPNANWLIGKDPDVGND